jgi:hypothetical protein
MIIITIQYPHLGIGSRRLIETIDSPNCDSHMGFDGPWLNTESIFSGSRCALVKWDVSGRLVGFTQARPNMWVVPTQIHN